MLLVILMFFGGCAGSTAGGIKMIRIQVISKAVLREIQRIMHPKIIKSVKVGNVAIEEKQVANIIGFFLLFMLSYITITFLMSFFLEDFTTLVTAVTACLSNIGPGLAGVGATENFSWIPLPGKWILSVAMLLGRLELYTVFVALSFLSWKR
ncbi:potassium transport system, membrane component TrkH [Chitinivibrio alkaliphilus ACht1]|uniref:Potassium transport system, membrane component TrkH n=1 Tax=Chitinivibrio alkaliphilus ACht1 TaxID=1313304 RepID=U7D6B7_9BACT|nr:potassium transport system, membrane component TrkH [Chitinivibrio alkaliphilus ACht1]